MLRVSVCLSCLICGSLTSQAVQAQEAVAEAVAVAAASQGERAVPTARPLTVTAGLTDDTRITGTLVDTNSVAIKTAFGEASIPLSEVAGIRFPSAEDTSTTIVMLNGDSITGATDVKFINVETSWGNAKINGPAVSTMLFVPDLTWQSNESLGGKRWALVESKRNPPPTLPGTAPQSGSSNANVIPASAVQGNPQIIFGR